MRVGSTRTSLRGGLLAALIGTTLVCGPGCAAARGSAVVPSSVLVLPPDSPELDPLLDTGATRLAEPWRRLMVEVGREVLPRAVVEELVDRGALAVGLTPAALADFVTSDPEAIERRLGYRSLAEAHRADHVLRLTYSGTIRQGAGTVEWFGGWLTTSYPSDTVWYRLVVDVALIDAASGDVVRTFQVDAEDHTTLFGRLGGRTTRDRMVALARDVSRRIARIVVP